MLLSVAELTYRLEEGRIEPFWLGPNDEGWVEEARLAMLAVAGLSVDEAEDVVRPRLAQLGRRFGLPARVLFALWALERRRWELRIASPVPPPVLRDVVFDLAATHPHDEALDLAAARFRVHPEEIVPALFADRRGRRLLVPPAEPSTAAATIVRYNLAVAEALVARSMEIEAFVRDDVARIVGTAKRLGLVAWCEQQGAAVRLSLSGPLALFHETTKYGRLLARFVPALASAPSWSLRAHVVLGEKSGWLELDDAGPLGRLHGLPGDAESSVGRRVARALRRGGHAWRVEDAELVHVDGAILVPDFALVTEGRRVLVDVVPFATPEHLARKVDLARKMRGRLLLCVAARFAPAEPMPFVMRYRGAVDAGDLVETAERITGGAWPSAQPCPG